MKKIFYILLILPLFSLSQETIKGVVTEKTDGDTLFPLAGANVFWLDTSVGAVTDIEGGFSIPYQTSYTKLVISYVGFKTDTLTVTKPRFIKHLLEATGDLDQIVLTARKQATSRSYMSAQNIMTISSDEL